MALDPTGESWHARTERQSSQEDFRIKEMRRILSELTGMDMGDREDPLDHLLRAVRLLNDRMEDPRFFAMDLLGKALLLKWLDLNEEGSLLTARLPNTSPTPETVQEREAFLEAAKVEFVESWKSLSARPNMSPQSIWDMIQDSDAH